MCTNLKLRSGPKAKHSVTLLCRSVQQAAETIRGCAGLFLQAARHPEKQRAGYLSDRRHVSFDPRHWIRTQESYNSAEKNDCCRLREKFQRWNVCSLVLSSLCYLTWYWVGAGALSPLVLRKICTLELSCSFTVSVTTTWGNLPRRRNGFCSCWGLCQPTPRYWRDWAKCARRRVTCLRLTSTTLTWVIVYSLRFA